MRGRIALAILAIVLLFPGLVLANALHSWRWFFVVCIAEAVLLWLNHRYNRPEKRDVTPQQLADELERHLVGNEGPYDWDATTSLELADERLDRLIPRLIEYDRLETAEKREQFREIIESLRRGEIPE
jgi:hypothetical protein